MNDIYWCDRCQRNIAATSCPHCMRQKCFLCVVAVLVAGIAVIAVLIAAH